MPKDVVPVWARVKAPAAAASALENTKPAPAVTWSSWPSTKTIGPRANAPAVPHTMRPAAAKPTTELRVIASIMPLLERPSVLANLRLKSAPDPPYEASSEKLQQPSKRRIAQRFCVYPTVVP